MTLDNIIEKIYADSHWSLCKCFAEQYLDFYPNDTKIKEILINCCFKLRLYDKINTLIESILVTRPIDSKLLDRCIKYKVDISEHLLACKIQYPHPHPHPHRLDLITCSITSCRRLKLFIKTMDSFLSTCTDLHLISKFICIDDNSSEEDRKNMKKRYPFINFVWKTSEEKGHAKSMQMLVSMVQTPYLLHIEDDWQFFDGKDLIRDALEVLDSNNNIGQVLFNQNYAEIPEQIPVGGHETFTDKHLRYFIHEHCIDTYKKEAFLKNHPNKIHCNYWPHFSLRPSLIRTCIFKHISFENIISFEQTFAWKYIKAGYISAFLQGIRCKHIGRLTTDKTSITKLNAYDLIREPQFQPLKTFEAYVINLERRADRLSKFISATKGFDFKINVFPAVDGKKLIASPRLNALFQHNDYNMRRGIVGCALSHLKLWARFYNNPSVDYYCIFEDDVVLNNDFQGNLNRILSLLTNEDIIFLGATPNPKCLPIYVNQGIITVSSAHSLKHYLGGLFGYIITIKGIKKLFDYIEQNTMTNAIDTMMQKVADIAKVAYIIPAICHHENVNDTDIQKDFDTSLTSVKEIGNIVVYDQKGIPSFEIES